MKKASFVLLFCCAVLLGADMAKSQYLVPGIGVEGSLALGEHKKDAKQNDWNSADNDTLEYRVDKEGRIVLIKCDSPKCITDRNIRIGSPETDLIRWYGAAREVRPIPGGMLHGYLGISFAVRNGMVEAIYIFPRYLLKK